MTDDLSKNGVCYLNYSVIFAVYFHFCLLLLFPLRQTYCFTTNPSYRFTLHTIC